MPRLGENTPCRGGSSSFDRLQSLTSQHRVNAKWAPPKRRVRHLPLPVKPAQSVAAAAVANPGPRADPGDGSMGRYAGPKYPLATRARGRRSRSRGSVRSGAELARMEIANVNAAMTDWSFGGQVDSTRSGNAVFRRPHATSGDTSGSSAPRMLEGMHDVPAVRLQDQLVKLVDYEVMAAELGMPLSLVSATAQSLESRAPYENYEYDEAAVFGAVLDSRNRIVADLHALPAGSQQTELAGPAKWHTMSQPGLSPAALKAQLVNQRRMQQQGPEHASGPPDQMFMGNIDWDGPLEQRHEQLAAERRESDARWEAAAGPSSIHRAEVDAFRKSRHSDRLSGRLGGWKEDFKKEAGWIAMRQMQEAAADAADAEAGDEEARGARIDGETAARLPGWCHSEEQRSVRETNASIQLEANSRAKVVAAEQKLLNAEAKAAQLARFEQLLLESEASGEISGFQSPGGSSTSESPGLDLLGGRPSPEAIAILPPGLFSGPLEEKAKQQTNVELFDQIIESGPSAPLPPVLKVSRAKTRPKYRFSLLLLLLCTF